METKTKAPVYRVAKYRGSQPIKWVGGTYATEDEARTAAARLNPNRSIYSDAAKVVLPEQARDTAISMKAYTLECFLNDREYLLAADFDDARGRLIKLADLADRRMSDLGTPAVRKGFLKTETGLALFFEVFLARQDHVRIRGGYLTQQEEADRRTRGMTRDDFAVAAKSAVSQAVRSLVAASLHADEY